MRRRNRHRHEPEPLDLRPEPDFRRVLNLLDEIDRQLGEPVTVGEHEQARRDLDRFVGTSTGRARP